MMLLAATLLQPAPPAALALLMLGLVAGTLFGLWLRGPRQHHVRIDHPVRVELRNLRIMEDES
jgi:hypothetical protein